MQKLLRLDEHSSIFVAGHRGLVGSAVVRALTKKGLQSKLLLKTKQELDLTNAQSVASFFEQNKPSLVIMSAAKVGGIEANRTYPVEFMLDNLKIQNNIIEAAYKHGTKRLVFLGSSCIYPKMAPQPLKEEYLLTGALEQTNEAYALAKISGLKLCQYYAEEYSASFTSVMPTNLYGPQDNFHPLNSHVIPGMMRRFHEAKKNNTPSVTVWGTGKPFREFLHVDDLAAGILAVCEKWDQPTAINIGTGSDITIGDLAHLMAKVTGYTGKIEFDTNKPDGTPKKLLDISKMKALGWSPAISLEQGLSETYKWACDQGVFENTGIAK